MSTEIEYKAKKFTNETILDQLTQTDLDNLDSLVTKYFTPEAAYTPTFTGFGTPTSVNFSWMRMGNKLKVIGKFTTGINTAVEARLSLPLSLASDSTFITSIQGCGNIVAGTASALVLYALIESGVSYTTFGIQSAALAGLTKINGNTIGNGITLSVQFEIPINGWNT